MHLHAAELAIREASWRFDNDRPCGEAADTAKYLAAETRVMKIAPDSQEMICNYISAQVLGLPKSY